MMYLLCILLFRFASSNVKDTAYMFANADMFDANLNGWKTGKIIQMVRAFVKCGSAVAAAVHVPSAPAPAHILLSFP